MENLNLINKKNDEMNNLISTIIKTRKEKNMTQKQLADKIGVSVYQIRKLERKDGSVTLDVVLCVAKALDLQFLAFSTQGNLLKAC